MRSSPVQRSEDMHARQEEYGSEVQAHIRSTLMPPVTNASSDVFIHFTVFALSWDAGEPQTALPVATFQITRLLSSDPPMEARYLPLPARFRDGTQ